MKAVMFSRDPGGTNQMIGVHAALEGLWNDGAAASHPGIVTLMRRLGGRPDIAVYAKDFALDLWRGDGIAATAWPVADGPGRQDAIIELLRGLGAEAVLTATSDVDDDTDQALWVAAHALNIPSHAFVDGDYNVLRRFHTADGAPCWADFIYAPGSRSAQPLIDAGRPPDSVTIIPDFPILVQRRRAGSAHAGAAALRQAWRAGDSQRVVLFASENVLELSALGKPVRYSEIGCLKMLLDALDGTQPIDGIGRDADALVIVRPHPKENPAKFADLVREGRVLVSRQGSSAEAILAADLVVGMESTLLREALASNKPVVSLVGAVLQQTDPVVVP